MVQAEHHLGERGLKIRLKHQLPQEDSIMNGEIFYFLVISHSLSFLPLFFLAYVIIDFF